MPDVSFTGLLIVVAIAFGAPLVVALLPRVRLPSVVLEIVLGIVVGPSMLNWVHDDLAVSVLAVIGLAFLLFLAGLEVDLERLGGRSVRLAAVGFAVSLALGVCVGLVLAASGFARSPVLVAITLLATSLGLVVPVLKDARHTDTAYGQLVIAGGTLADFGAVILLTLFFSEAAGGPGARALLLALFAMLIAAVGLVVARAGRSKKVSGVVTSLQDTTAQIRVRGACLLLVGFVAIAATLGLETILGAFLAGVILRLVDRDRMMDHPNLRLKLEGLGYGFFVPIFFVSSGVAFRLSALFSSAAAVAAIPVYLLALALVRGLPAFVYRRAVGGRAAVAAGLLQATSLPFIVTATRIGVSLGVLAPASAAGLVAAGLASVLLFPTAALRLFRPERKDRRGNGRGRVAAMPEDSQA